ncbi:Inner centromere protein-related protein pic1 [Trichoderma ghanense]|uniref:Inner centromere protein-related protein pic1 n=1 Tax=Trichoderma ghanense TaxID=65468 RepID=A0ABY2H5N4_9HYPO
MTAVRGPRLQVGSAAWVGEERASALQIVKSEVEEFSYSAHNEVEWLNEHMAAILNENEVNITEAFKTPGKLRGKTPHAARKGIAAEARKPLSDVFAASPTDSRNQSSDIASHSQPHHLHQVALKAVPLVTEPVSPRRHVFSPSRPRPPRGMQDSGYYGSQDHIATDPSEGAEPEDFANPYSDIVLPPGGSSVRRSPVRKIVSVSPSKTFQPPKEDSTARALPDVPSNQATNDAETSAKESDTDEAYSDAPVISPVRSPKHPPISAEQSNESSDDEQSASEGSSPIRPLVRKSSLNFASLPAREPLNSGKSLGARQSRNSHFDTGNSSRTSYYQRQTGGKSLGNLAKRDSLHEEKEDGLEREAEDPSPVQETSEGDRPCVNHTKTYTQRLQDQISMLSRPQGGFGQTKTASNAAALQQEAPAARSITSPKPASLEKELASTTPRASPEDDDADWIESPNTAKKARESRPLFTKSHTTDIMEGIQDQDDGYSRQAVEHASHSLSNHFKSSSISTMPTDPSALARDTTAPPNAIPISFANLATSQGDLADNPFKSPPRRESPLKQVKSKLSSILKSSRGLLASNAAVNADGKSLMSPSTTRLALHAGASTESVALQAQDVEPQPTEPTSPSKPIARRTRASTEREKEQKRRENEVKRMEEQMDKLDKAREKEREKARAFTQEQEKVATMEKEIAAKRPDEKLAFKATPNPPKAGPSSPHKMRAGEESQSRQFDRDVDMSDAQRPMPPPSSTKPTLPGPVARGKDSKRPVKPIKDSASKIKAPPTVIRVNTGSQHSQYQPAGSRVSTASHDTLNSNHSTASSKSGKSIYQAKSSAPNVKAPPSAGRSKAAELAARKKEQDERESQRRREAKAEMERKRIAAQEEQRKQDQQRRLELERQRQQEEEKKSAQRQAALEKAKQTRAPPPAVRSQPSGTSDSALPQPKSASSRAEGQPARPPSRLAGMRDDPNRPVNAILSNATKAGAKRTLGPETTDDTYSRPPPSRGGPAYQTKDSKRRRTSEHNDDESEVDTAPKIKGAPVRPSTGFKKDLPTKSAFQPGYTAAPHGASRDLFKAAVTSQHHSHMKAAHPLDMAQISKGPIPFAPGSSAAGASHKTPARPGQLGTVKGSVRKASPRFQNGDSIELPEIQTDDDEDDDEESGGMTVAAWADSPDLRRALMRQESMDPTQIFGPPAPLIMEEVFSKSKDKWHKFRQRTSSANWSGLDRLTEDDIRKDMAARDKLRRDGGWSYEMSKDML